MQKSWLIKGIENFFSNVFCRLIRFYQICISPAFPPCCRYTPTCSCYALDAIRKHGAAKGAYFAARRILRCNPLFKGGYDPVP